MTARAAAPAVPGSVHEGDQETRCRLLDDGSGFALLCVAAGDGVAMREIAVGQNFWNESESRGVRKCERA
jgi:hypothetical protein